MSTRKNAKNISTIRRYRRGMAVRHCQELRDVINELTDALTASRLIRSITALVWYTDYLEYKGPVHAKAEAFILRKRVLPEAKEYMLYRSKANYRRLRHAWSTNPERRYLRYYTEIPKFNGAVLLRFVNRRPWRRAYDRSQNDPRDRT